MLPENDRWSETRAQLLAQELIFGDDYITTGTPVADPLGPVIKPVRP